jgi:hypothetical protein
MSCHICKIVTSEEDGYVCGLCKNVTCENCYTSDDDESFYCNGCKKMYCEECVSITKPNNDCGFCVKCEATLTLDEMHEFLK